MSTVLYFNDCPQCHEDDEHLNHAGAHKADATSSPEGLVCTVCGRPVTQVHHRDGTISFRHRLKA